MPKGNPDQAAQWVKKTSPNDDYLPPMEPVDLVRELPATGDPEVVAIAEDLTPTRDRARSPRPERILAVKKRGGGSSRVVTTLTAEEYRLKNAPSLPSKTAAQLVAPEPKSEPRDTSSRMVVGNDAGMAHSARVRWQEERERRQGFGRHEGSEVDSNDLHDDESDDAFQWDEYDEMEIRLVGTGEDQPNWYDPPDPPDPPELTQQEKFIRHKNSLRELLFGHDLSFEDWLEVQRAYVACLNGKWASVDDARAIAAKWRTEYEAKQTCANPNGCEAPTKAKGRCGPCLEYRRTHKGDERPLRLLNRQQRRAE